MRKSSYLAFACLMLVASAARATPCPKVMIVLDISGSMDDTPSGGGTGPTKLDLAKKAIARLLSTYGTRMPFGLTTFSNETDDCYNGIDILVEPADGTASEITSRANALVADSTTNTGEAIKTVAADPNMASSDGSPGSYIMLITDGEPNCPDPDTATDPAYTVAQIGAAATAGIKTFVIGFGALPSADQAAMNMMADAGGEPCMTTACGSKHFFAAESDTALDAAIDAISQTIIGEIGGQCDDSCYANACPTAGNVCVQGKCAANPCAGVTCPDGQYCYTDGMTPGACIPACANQCPTGQTCESGICKVDPCATASCVMGQVCVNGGCVTDPCGALSCDSHYICKDGQCIDDPCLYVTCPMNTLCQPGTGQCHGNGKASASTGTTTSSNLASTCCSYGALGVGAPALMPLLVLLMLALLGRRRRLS